MTFHFIQMADPQFGMFAQISQYSAEEVAERRARGLNVRPAPEPVTGFADETRLYTAAIDIANRLKPSFVVVCGDLVHDYTDQAQIDELNRITATLDDDVPIHLVAGNHDVGEAPTSDSLALYRQRFGADNYSFDVDGTHFAVINSSVAFDPANVPAEWDRIAQFMADDFSTARRRGAERIVLFTHHPLFLQDRNADDQMWTIPGDRRDLILSILKDYGASAVFAGHLHRNEYTEQDGLTLVTTGAVGYPFGEEPSGLRIVQVDDDAIRHRYYGMDEAPGEMPELAQP